MQILRGEPWYRESAGAPKDLIRLVAEYLRGGQPYPALLQALRRLPAKPSGLPELMWVRLLQEPEVAEGLESGRVEPQWLYGVFWEWQFPDKLKYTPVEVVLNTPEQYLPELKVAHTYREYDGNGDEVDRGAVDVRGGLRSESGASRRVYKTNPAELLKRIKEFRQSYGLDLVRNHMLDNDNAVPWGPYPPYLTWTEDLELNVNDPDDDPRFNPYDPVNDGERIHVIQIRVRGSQEWTQAIHFWYYMMIRAQINPAG